MGSSFLVVLRLGNSIVPKAWITRPRTWDLLIDYYGTNSELWAESEALIWRRSGGSKYPALQQFLQANIDLVRKYDYIFLPDDDIHCSAYDVERMFEIAARYSLDLSQPSLAPTSFISRSITLNRTGSILRYTNWIEGMVPCFKLATLELCVDSFHLSTSGYGLDNLWSQRVVQTGGTIAIIDAVQVVHTRPFNGRNHQPGDRSAFEELKTIINQYGAPEPVLKVLGAIDHQGVFISESSLYRHEMLQTAPW
jgi:hypothetical protein